MFVFISHFRICFTAIFPIFLLAISLSAQPLNMDLLKNMKARSIGPAGMSGRVTAIDVVVNNPEVIFVGTASGGLWKSESGGIAWEPIFDDQPVASIGAVAITQQNPDIIWAGTGEGNPRNSQTSGNGIYKSLDGGKNWKLMGLEHTHNIHRVLIHPKNPDIVYAGVQGSAWGPHPERGVYRTFDGGKNWEKILFINDSTGVGDMVIDPVNPNKLIVGMWEFRRWPWFFKSGGPGSGLYITFDGGDTWEERTDKDGLPKGELGRIGLAIAPGNPKYIYAMVESKKNALYGSQDGGFNWRKINDKGEIGNRPFYYSDIFVDPKNENRIYSLYSMISRSEDGGKSFRVIVPYSAVHPDHHAFWIHPENTSFLINGNDGGLAISRDMGESWRFIENLPLAQYYHINVDEEYPYHVYGGMQDNGSWRGPAYVWRSGGIRNAYWEELYFGDGFDVVPDPENAEVGYAMSQGGSLGRYNLDTRMTKFIQPVHPDGLELRFNWNAGIAQDPFDPATIYYGSQFLHKSTDRGENWEMISPDLTTNDPEKQKQLESGGLTYDVTQAENFTTIVAISPSPIQQDLIWVGTDDGNLQLTQDGGKSWTNLIENIKDVPAGSWIPQIHPSSYQAGEAFVVINNYRRNDWNTYVYHTKDFGKSWESVASQENVWGYALSFVQDPVEPKLMFLGTEFGLYISIDGAQNWTKWTHGYPTVSTMDMKIHPREHDLVIGTFGRAAFVIDDIRPLREMAQAENDITQEALHLFSPPTAVMSGFQQATGTRFAADAIFSGENRRRGAMISYIVNPALANAQKEDSTDEGKTKADSVKIEVFNASRELLRTIRQKPDSGLNRIYWRMDKKGPRFPTSGQNMFFGNPSGGPVLPGTYKLVATYGDFSDSTEIEVILDPGLNIDLEEVRKVIAMNDERNAYVELITKATDRLKEAAKTLNNLKPLFPDSDEGKELGKQSKAMADSIKQLLHLILPDDSKQGIYRNPDILLMKIFGSSSYFSSLTEGPNGTQELVLSQFRAQTERLLDQINDFFGKEWKAFREKVEEQDLSPFKDYEPLGKE